MTVSGFAKIKMFGQNGAIFMREDWQREAIFEHGINGNAAAACRKVCSCVDRRELAIVEWQLTTQKQRSNPSEFYKN